MNKREESYLEMMDRAIHVVDDNESSLTTTPRIKINNNLLKDVYADIVFKEGQLKKSTGGKTEAKHASMDDLIHQTVVISGGIFSYAQDNNLTELEVAFDLDESDLIHLRQAEVPIKCKIVLDKALQLGEALVEYGITKTETDLLRSYLDQFSTKSTDMGTGLVNRGSARTLLSDDFDKAERIMKANDKLIKKLEYLNPELFAKYSNSRIIRAKPSGYKGKPESGTDSDSSKPDTTKPDSK